MPKKHTLQLSNLDAQESAFFARELEQIKSRTYDIVYPDLKGRMFVPASQEPADPGAETITYQQFDRFGMAKMIANYADDLPRVDVAGKEFTTPVRSLGASFGYNLQEVRASTRARKNLPQRKANAARQVIEEKLDELIAIGDSVTGLVGFLNNANVPTASVVGAVWSVKATVDAEDILFDINDAVGDMLALTKGREMPDTVLVPVEQYTILAQTRLVDRDRTLLEHFLASNPWIKSVEHWYRLDGAGVGGTDRMVVYKKSPDKLFYEIPQDFEMLNIQENGLEFVTPCHARSGGVIIPYPLSVSYRDGI
jgi:hypothetical protein